MMISSRCKLGVCSVLYKFESATGRSRMSMHHLIERPANVVLLFLSHLSLHLLLRRRVKNVTIPLVEKM